MNGAAADEALARRRDAPDGVDPKESARLNALRRYAILDSPPDAHFDCITRMAARLLAMPVAAISLVDHERQWFKSCHGVELQETLRAGSLCGLAVLGDAVLEVPDARADPRFANSPLVTGPPHICFYAGAPLTTEDGHNLGALCVIDRTPRSLSSEERLLLLDLARIVVELIRLRSFSLDLRNEIAERERTEQALRASEQRFRDFAATASDWFWETDAEHRFIWMSANVAALTGVPRESQYGKTRFELMAPCTDPALIEAHRRVLEARQPFRDLEYVRRGPNGDIWISTSGVPVFGDEGRFAGYRGVGREIGAKKRAEERLRHLAHHDDLTGLPNRYLLQDRLRQALALARRGGERVGLLLLDLDQFKEVNDALGHPVGDRLLRATAGRLAAVVRASDTLARLGGDEFAVLQPSVQDAGAIGALADRLVGAFAAPFAVDGQEINVAASVGVAVSPDDGTDPDELVRRADMALYRAKHGGSGRFRFFEPAMDVEVRSRRELECELRRALDAAEFVLHYQPQVELATGRVTGVEALIRWQHPERGLVPPGEFVPVAEACGLILRLGAWVLGEACRQARAWQDAGTTLAIAVNLSPVQLRHGGVLQAIDDALREHGLDGRWLEVELTESLLLEGSEGATNRTLQGLATRGIRLTLDDFGTGYSSLAYLKRLPVQRIKIDRSFVCDVGTDPDHDAVVRAIVTLGHTLGKEVVAEGVETKAQLAFLRRLGCDSAQGFLLGRPQEAAQLTPLLAA